MAKLTSQGFVDDGTSDLEVRGSLYLTQDPIVTSSWPDQATWYIDAVNGSDSNDGLTVATALASHAELERRVNDTDMSTDVTVEVLSDLNEPIRMRRRHVTPGTNYRMVYTSTTYVSSHQLVTGSLATYTAPSHTSGTNGNATQVTSAAVTDWTTYVNKRIRMTSGAASGAIAFITRANPEGAGVATARTTAFVTSGNGIIPALSTPAPGDSFVIEDMPTVSGMELYFESSQTRLPSKKNLYLDGFNVVSAGSWTTQDLGGFVGANNCYIDSLGPVSGIVPGFFSGCLFTNTSFSQNLGRGNITMYAGGFSASTWYIYSNWIVGRWILFDDAPVHVTTGASVTCGLEGMQCFDSSTDGLSLSQMGQFVCAGGTSRLSGKGNTGVGVRCLGGRFMWEEPASVPTITGTGGDLSFADSGQPGPLLSWASTPIKAAQSEASTSDVHTPDAYEGIVTFGAADTSIGVTFPNHDDMGWTDYDVTFVELTPTGTPTPSVGPWVASGSQVTTGFSASISAAPGAGTSRSFTYRVHI